MRRPLVAFSTVAALACFGLGGCAEGQASRSPATPVAARLPLYEGTEANLFDDVVEPAALGSGVEPEGDRRVDMPLRSRAQRADHVLRVRVATVSSRPTSGDPAYEVLLKPVEAFTKRTVPETITLVVQKGDSSFALIKGHEGTLPGKTLVGFFKNFGTPQGEVVQHVHLAADSASVVAAVKDALLLDELR